jgi:hypothetical protein
VWALGVVALPEVIEAALLRRQMRRRCMGDEISVTNSVISPSGVRIATAQLDGLRIITPSSTACPP